VVGTAGVFVSMTGEPAWRRVAMPSVPTSRDVAIAGDRIVWTAGNGVFARRLPALGEEQRIASPDRGEPRYPLVAVCTEPETVDVLWTADRARLVHSVLGSRAAVAEPPEAPPGDRLTALAAAAGDGAFWLAARTEDGTVSVTRWDPLAGRVDGWRTLEPPVPVAVVTIVPGPTVLGFTADGRLIAATGAGPWHGVDLPPGVPHSHRAPQTIASAGGRLLVADGSTTWLATLDRSDDVSTLSDVRILPM
jgi:hypothetical protein